MTCAARNPEIPPAPFAKGGGPAAVPGGKSSSSTQAFPPLEKGGRGGFSPGFTLVEVIVTIIAAGILGAIFINFMGTAMSRSSRSIEYVEGEASAEATLERIMADYVYQINRDPDNALATIKSEVDPPTLRYGNNVSAQYITYQVSGNTGNENVLTSGTSDTLKITVTAMGNDLTTLLTKSGLAQSPAVAF